MRSSRLGIIVLIAVSVLFTTNCAYYNRIMSRKNLVDGSQAYKERKFSVAEDLFRRAAARDPEGSTFEGRIAQVFLARTLHSMYIGDRQRRDLAEQAIVAYQKALSLDKDDQSSYKAVSGLYENLQQTDNWQKWVTDRANRADILPQNRAEAFTSLAAKKNTCANEITDTEATKKSITKDGKPAFQFVAPANPADLATLKGCVDDGMKFIDQAVALETPEVKSAKNLNVKTLSDDDLKKNLDLLKVFESARSYKAALTNQSMRLAEMENRTPDRDRLKTESDTYKAQFTELSQLTRSMEDEIEARRAAAAEAENANANANANAAKK